jgi:hypothetical protein
VGESGRDRVERSEFEANEGRQDGGGNDGAMEQWRHTRMKGEREGWREIRQAREVGAHFSDKSSMNLLVIQDRSACNHLNRVRASLARRPWA